MEGLLVGPLRAVVYVHFYFHPIPIHIQRDKSYSLQFEKVMRKNLVRQPHNQARPRLAFFALV